MKRFLSNITILFATIIIGASLFEIFIRQFIPQYDPSGHLSFTTNDNGVPIALNKGFSRQIKNTGDYDVSIKINGLGLRESKEFSTSTKSDIVVVGDSFSFGWGVEEHERYSNQLGAILTDQKVFNISIPTDFDGYGKLINYAKENSLNIHKLVVGVTMENDLHHYNVKRSSPDKRRYKIRETYTLRHLKIFLREHSAAYFLITSLVHSNSTIRKLAIFMNLIRPNLRGIPAFNFSQQIIVSSANRLHSLVRQFNSIILIIPSRALWVGTKDRRTLADQIHKAFLKELDNRKLIYIDMRSLMEKNKAPLKYHFKFDGHWTRDAHQIAAKALAKVIRAK